MLRFGLAVVVLCAVGCGDAAPLTDASVDAPSAPDAVLDRDAPTPPPDGPPAFCADPGPDGGVATDVEEALRALPGVANLVATAGSNGYTFYSFTFRQLVDHTAPGGTTFTQRVGLLHIDAGKPTVLGTQGYDLTVPALHEEPTRLLGGNQVEVEHRFFGSSVPDPLDWSRLTIWQAAADDHCLVTALRGIYSGRWVATGQSKGGMTALFYRRFFPDDVDATVSYVTPLSLAAPDPRYIAAVEAGPHPDCRQKLRDLQRVAIERRAVIEAHMETLTSTYQHLGLDEAFEHLVLELPFGFWQVGLAFDCDGIPDGSASDESVIQFLDLYGDFSAYGDADLARFGPYYVQASTQLGYPQIDETNLAGMLDHPGTDLAPAYVPTGAPTRYDPTPMREVDAWVRTQGKRLLFIYGETDPWSGGEVQLGGATDSLRLIVPDGNHSSLISDLGAGDRQAAMDALARWTAD